jgi:MFS transporter, ACS family, D-galactonate transporter
MQKRVGNLRWGIALLLGFGIVINYFDRTNIAVATKPFEHDFHLSAFQMGIVLSSYLWSYTLMQIPVGALLDKIGVKWLIRVGTIIWSIATFLTALVSGLGLVLLTRILLGVAESPAFPGSAKATGYWFPLRERGLATSAFDGAAKFSNVIGVPIVAAAVTVWGWRAGFYVTGTLSLFYAVLFWFTYRDPKEAKHLSKEEYAYIVEGGAQQETAPVSTAKSLGFLLRQRKMWGLALGFAAYNYSFYLFLSWLPGYLETQLHMSVLKSGFYTIIPWIVATITDIFIGGLLVDMLVRRGRASTNVRRTLIVLGMILGLTVVGAAFTSNANVAIIWISIALGGLAFSAPIAWSIPSIIAPPGTVGTVGSIMNFLGNISGIVAPILAGYIFDRTGSFLLNFLIAGAILVVGIFCYLFLLGKIEQIEAPFATKAPIPEPNMEPPTESSPHRKAS